MNARVPILITAFNRPESLRRSLEALSGYSNPIYIWVDGPRSGNSADQNLVSLTETVARESAANVQGIYRSEFNLGLKSSVSKAISWVFEKFESAIILEDDILIDSNFISFAEQALEYYRDILQIGSIAAYSPAPVGLRNSLSHDAYLSVYTESWGWATWKNRWQVFEGVDLETFRFNDCLPPTSKNLFAKYSWARVLKKIKSGKLSSWAYLWMFTSWSHNWLTVVPKKNLSSNFGSGASATHTSTVEFREIEPLSNLPIKFPNHIEQNLVLDRWVALNVFSLSFRKALINLVGSLRNF
jgi:hypothetical protein